MEAAAKKSWNGGHPKNAGLSNEDAGSIHVPIGVRRLPCESGLKAVSDSFPLTPRADSCRSFRCSTQIRHEFNSFSWLRYERIYRFEHIVTYNSGKVVAKYETAASRRLVSFDCVRDGGDALGCRAERLSFSPGAVVDDY